MSNVLGLTQPSNQPDVPKRLAEKDGEQKPTVSVERELFYKEKPTVTGLRVSPEKELSLIFILHYVDALGSL